MSLKDLSYPKDLEYSSDGQHVPLEFYLEVFPESKIALLKLGYFSSKAIQVLAYGFAQFIYNGGSIKIITNHFLYKSDKELLSITSDDLEDEHNSKFLSDIEWLSRELSDESAHFFSCLKFLVKIGRVEIIPVMLKPSRMTHYKEGVFIDDDGNSVFGSGSCNFTANGLLENGETLSISRSWGADEEQYRISNKRDNIKSILKRDDPRYIYLDSNGISDAISSIGVDADIEELLQKEKELLGNFSLEGIRPILEKYKKKLDELICEYKESPRFPYIEGPRDYQIEAYQNWVEAGRKGIFAMATGTGKTITSLNCLLNEFHTVNHYQAIITVPSKALIEQWNSEVKNFNFRSIYLVSSDYKWTADIDRLNTALAFNSEQSFILIVTYQTFSDEKFQKRISNLPSQTLLIADEAHNIGGAKIRAILPKLNLEKRIALSATPKRKFDEDGNQIIEDYFNSREPYTYNFSMGRAIKEGILCPYDYYPSKVYLDEEEMQAYSDISRKLQRLFDQNTGTFRNKEAAEILLLERKRIIHKAANKLEAFRLILKKVVNDRGSLSFSFIYVPEGDEAGGKNLLDAYLNCMEKEYPAVKAHHYTSRTENRSEIMRHFEEGVY